MKSLRRDKSIIATTIVSLAFTGLFVPQAVAQEASQPITENCEAPDQDNPVQIPYSHLATVEELIADGTIDSDLVEAFEDVHVDYEIVGPAPMALPVVAAAAVAVVSWCAKGAFGSLAPSFLQQMAHAAHNGIEPPSWAMNAIFGCAGGPVLGVLTTQTMRVKFAGAVLAAVMKLRNFG